MSVLDTDAKIQREADCNIKVHKIKNTANMKEFQTFANDHIEAFARLHGELFHMEYYTPYSYTGINRFFQLEFPESRNYSKAAYLIRDFLKEEGLIDKKSEIAHVKIEEFEEVVKYVCQISQSEDTQQIFELLLHDKQNYAEKISNICQDLAARFSFLKTPAVVTAILSLMTGWCPILHKKFVPDIKNVSFKNFQDKLFRAIYTLAPIIEYVAKTNGIDNITFFMVWALILTMINIYNEYSKF